MPILPAVGRLADGEPPPPPPLIEAEGEDDDDAIAAARGDGDGMHRIRRRLGGEEGRSAVAS